MLDARCEEIDRDPAAIARSCQALWFLHDDQAKADALIERVAPRPAIGGPLDKVTEAVAGWADVGVDEVIVPDFTLGTGAAEARPPRPHHRGHRPVVPLRALRLLLWCAAIVGLAACRLDATVELTIGADGTGELAVTAVADADVVAQAPGLAESLQFADAVAAGWVVEGPTATEDGGLTVTLRHPVTSAEEATNLLASLGPPFTGMTPPAHGRRATARRPRPR